MKASSKNDPYRIPNAVPAEEEAKRQMLRKYLKPTQFLKKKFYTQKQPFDLAVFVKRINLTT